MQTVTSAFSLSGKVASLLAPDRHRPCGRARFTGQDVLSNGGFNIAGQR